MNLKHILTISFLLVPQIVKADALVYERQKQISLLEEYRDNYNIVRDKFYLGETGLVNFVKLWTRDVTLWANEWDSIWVAVQELKATNNSLAVKNKLESKLISQGYALRTLQQRYTDFTQRSRHLRQLLFSKPIPYNENELYDFKIAELVKANNTLQSHVVSLETAMLQRSNRLETISQSALEGISVEVEFILASASPSQQTILRQILETLEASKALEPYREKIRKSRSDVATALIQSRYFQAKRRLDDLRKTFDKVNSEIKLMANVPEARKTTAMNDMRNLYAEANQSVTKVRPEQIPFYVNSFVKDYAIPQAKLKCKGAKSTNNCALANWLSRIPESKILKYDQVKLEALETAWMVVLDESNEDTISLMRKLQGQGV